MMNCKIFKERVSDYADFQTDERLRIAMHTHAAQCSACRKTLQEIQSLRLELAKLPEETLPQSFHCELVAAMDTAAGQRAHPMRGKLGRAERWLSRRPMMAGYSVGLALTIIIFTGVLASLNPMLRWVESPRYDIVYMPKEEMKPFTTRSQSSPPVHTVLHPTLEFEGGLASLPEALFLPSEDGGGVVIIAEVGPNGRAQCLRLMPPHNDPKTIATIKAALSEASFQPAMRRGHPVSSRIVLLMDMIYVRG